MLSYQRVCIHLSLCSSAQAVTFKPLQLETSCVSLPFYSIWTKFIGGSRIFQTGTPIQNGGANLLFGQVFPKTA